MLIEVSCSTTSPLTVNEFLAVLANFGHDNLLVAARAWDSLSGSEGLCLIRGCGLVAAIFLLA